MGTSVREFMSLALWLGGYVLLLLIVSYVVSRKQKSEDFLISGRNRGGWQIFASKFASAIGAGFFITYTGFAYEYGTGLFGLLFGLILGYLLFGYWASPKIHEFSKKHKFYTMGDFVGFKTKSEFSKKLTNVVSNFILFVWSLVGIVGGGKIISDFGLMSYSSAVVVTGVVILAYILLAGYRAVILTDVIQSVVILALLLVVTFSIVGAGNIGDVLSVSTDKIDIGTALAFLIFGVLSIFSYSNIYQLCYAADDKNKLKHGISLAILPVVAAATLLLLVGMFMAGMMPGLDTALVFTEALRQFLPAALLPLAIVLFFAGLMSSADTGVYAMASHHSLSRNHVQAPVRKIRVTTTAIVVLLTLVALVFSDIVDLSIFAGGLSVSLSAAMLYLLLGKVNRGRFNGSVFGGLIGLAVGLFFFGFEPVILLVVLAGTLLGLLYRKK